MSSSGPAPSSSPAKSAPPTPSFCTASEVPDREQTANTTAQTSPSQYNDVPDCAAKGKRRNGAETATTATALAPPVMSPAQGYREAKLLPRELRDQCKIYLEEQMYLPAIQMLSSTLFAGGNRTDPRPAFVPPHQHLAFLASLAVHPKFTNRPVTSDGQSIGSRAMQYLQALNGTVGPVGANLSAAFDFEPWRRQVRRGHSSDLESDDDDMLHGPFVEGYIVFSKAESFWKLVGWALNCSALHPERWRYWRVWLEFLVEVLEVDYAERETLDSDASGADANGATSIHNRRSSLLYRYVCSNERRASELNRSTTKGMLRAIFADGTESSVREFPELFPDEAKAKPAVGAKRKRGPSTTLDLENEQYGDWFDAEGYSSGGSQPGSPSARIVKKPRGRTKMAAVEDLPPSEGLVESVDLRMRLFELLGVAIRDHSDRADGLEDLYCDFCLMLRSLHLDIFSAFISPHRTSLPVNSLVTVIRETIEPLQPKSAPKPIKVDREAAEGGYVTIGLMQTCYLPIVASGGVDNNARFSLLVEALLRILWQAGQVQYTPELDEAVRNGVESRNQCRGGRGPYAKEPAKDEPARRVLAESGERLKLLLEIILGEEQMDFEDVVDQPRIECLFTF